MKRALPIVMLLLLAGCARNYQVRVNAIDKLDSRTYDTLIVAQALLDNAKIAINQGKLPVTAKPIVNNAGKSYTLLRDVWLEYRANPNETTAKKISDAALAVNQFIAELRGMGVRE